MKYSLKNREFRKKNSIFGERRREEARTIGLLRDVQTVTGGI